jgi:hypothetical protein
MITRRAVDRAGEIQEMDECKGGKAEDGDVRATPSRTASRIARDSVNVTGGLLSWEGSFFLRGVGGTTGGWTVELSTRAPARDYGTVGN